MANGIQMNLHLKSFEKDYSEWTYRAFKLLIIFCHTFFIWLYSNVKVGQAFW